MRILLIVAVTLIGISFANTANAGDRRYHAPPPVHPCSNGWYVTKECLQRHGYGRYGYRQRGHYPRSGYYGRGRSDADKALQVLGGIADVIIGADTIIDALEGDKRHRRYRGSRGDWYYKGRR